MDNPALRYAYELLERRDRSEKELRDKLSERYGEESSAEAVEKCVNLGIVNDKRYGENIFRRYNVKYGDGRIEAELYRHGIPRDTVKEIIEENSNGEETSKKAVKTLFKRHKGLPVSKDDYRKTAAYLGRQGFSPEEARQAILDYNTSPEVSET